MVDVYDKLFMVCKRRGIVYPAYEIYGGSAGFYDYGPLGARIKKNIQDLWRGFYLMKEGCAEIDCPVVTPYEVLRASGHVEEFTDFVTKCSGCGSSFRADHLVEEAGYEGTADALSADELDREIANRGIKCPECKGEFGGAYPMNLMFATEIGPGSGRQGFLRPETAQGIFTNFGNLYRFFREKLPFGAVQLGRGYRNEISPRQGMLRMREFDMMEAEIFVDPNEKSHPRFDEIADEMITLVPAASGSAIQITLREAVDGKIIGNEALAYFVNLTKEFLLAAGVRPDGLRFRQHLETEMAHYANDCWDAEIKSERFGWVECVGIADRSAYDLEAHMKSSGVDMSALRKFDEPRELERVKIVPNMKKLGPLFKGEAGIVKAALDEMDGSDANGDITLELDGKEYVVPSDAYRVERVIEKSIGERFIPHVIEPSYGLDRIFYMVLEHAYDESDKEGEEYRVLRLAPAVAPIKAGVFPLVSKDGLPELAQKVDGMLRASGIMTNYDESGTIGRRYARMDEVGTPYCITVDHESLNDDSVTVRERDSTDQVRVRVDELPAFFSKNL